MLSLPKEFQRKILIAVLKDPIIYFAMESCLKPAYFEDTVDRQIISIMRELSKQDEIPSVQVVLLELKKRKADKSIKRVSEFRKLRITEFESGYLQREVFEFARQQEIIKTIRESVDLVREAKFDEIESKFNSAFRMGRDNETLGTWFFEDVAERHKYEMTKGRVCMTLMPELDQHLDRGGLDRGDLGVIIAPPGRGKTFSLIYLAKAAILQNKKVVFYEFEMPEDKIARRLDASFTNIKIRDLVDKRLEVVSKIKKLGTVYQGRLLIKEFPIGSKSAADLDGHLNLCDRDGFVPDMVVIDYADRMLASTGREGDNRYTELRDVYVDLKRLAQTRGVSIWTASQSNRASLSKELVTIEDFSESFEKAMLSDVIVSLCQTRKEKEQEVMRLFLAKNRNEISEVIIPIGTNFRKGTFYRSTEMKMEDGKNTINLPKPVEEIPHDLKRFGKPVEPEKSPGSKRKLRRSKSGS
jgi:replicative DNA helicase